MKMSSDNRRISDPGTLTILTGNRGSGKTDFSLRIVETISKKNPEIKILTNIVMLEDTSKWNIKVITRLTELIEEIIENRRIHIVLDEAGIFASSGNAGNRKDLGQWEMFCKLFRKFGISLMWIDQRGVGSVPPTMRELANFHLHKHNKFLYEMWEGFKGEKGSKKLETRRISKEDRTSIPFDTNATGSFIMDLPEIDGNQLTIRDLFDELANVNSSRSRATMRAWMDKINLTVQAQLDAQIKDSELEGSGGVSRDLTLKEVVFWIYNHAEEKGIDIPKTSEISKILGRSQQSISRLKREWKIFNQGQRSSKLE